MTVPFASRGLPKAAGYYKGLNKAIFNNTGCRHNATSHGNTTQSEKDKVGELGLLNG